MSHPTLSKSAEIERNLERCVELIPSLLHDHRGQYALLRDTQVVDFFPTAIDAQIAGNQQFDDQLFSIQRVIEAPEELGYLSYALHPR